MTGPVMSLLRRCEGREFAVVAIGDNKLAISAVAGEDETVKVARRRPFVSDFKGTVEVIPQHVESMQAVMIGHENMIGAADRGAVVSQSLSIDLDNDSRGESKMPPHKHAHGGIMSGSADCPDFPTFDIEYSHLIPTIVSHVCVSVRVYSNTLRTGQA